MADTDIPAPETPFQRLWVSGIPRWLLLPDLRFI